MEQLKLDTIDKILNSKTNEDIEKHISLAINKLKDHKVNEHLIERFKLKLIDLIDLKKVLIKDSESIILLDFSISILKKINT